MNITRLENGWLECSDGRTDPIYGDEIIVYAKKQPNGMYEADDDGFTDESLYGTRNCPSEQDMAVIVGSYGCVIDEEDGITVISDTLERAVTSVTDAALALYKAAMEGKK